MNNNCKETSFNFQFGFVIVTLILSTFFSSNCIANDLGKQDTSIFRNGSLNEFVEWRDDRGELINAHDGGIIEVKGVYYWYGLALRPQGLSKDENNGAATTTGITLYSSKNLYNWKYEGVILATSTDTLNPLRAPMRMERPKIIFNAKTHKFVMWFHYVCYPGKHGEAIGTADAGVAVADKITGPFAYLGHHRPIDYTGAVKDCTLFLDTDSSAYFIYDRKLTDGSRCLHIVKLTDDFLHSSNQWAKIDVANRREAPVVMKHEGIYYLVTSDVSGWKSNSAKVYKASNIMGPWEIIGNPCIGEGSEATYNTQGTNSFNVSGDKNKVIIMLERHNTENFIRCSYVWLPVVFTANNELLFPYKNEWDLNSNLKTNN